jgi:hypothetical protein
LGFELNTEDKQEKAKHFAMQAEVELDELPAGAARDSLRDCLVYSVERRR